MLQWQKPVEKISCLGTCLVPTNVFYDFVLFCDYNLFISGTYQFGATWISFSGRGHSYLIQNGPSLPTVRAIDGFASLIATGLKLLPIYITVLLELWPEAMKTQCQSCSRVHGTASVLVLPREKIMTSVLRREKKNKGRKEKETLDSNIWLRLQANELVYWFS